MKSLFGTTIQFSSCYRGRGKFWRMRWGKAAAVALSQSYEVIAFREAITGLEEKERCS